MKQKYEVIKDDAAGRFVIKEYAELDKESLSLLCEQEFEINAVTEAAQKGSNAVIQLIRTKNMYPPEVYAIQIAETLMTLLKTENQDMIELVFDDLTFLSKRENDEPDEDDIDDGADDIDDLLEDDIEDEFVDDDSLNNISSPLKIADEDSLDIDDET